MTGTFLLYLPASAKDGSIKFIDAAFTSVSAVCVTGLTTLDTSKDFTLFGQVCIILLIQLGGLGIMGIATIAMHAMGRRLSLKQEQILTSLTDTDHNDLFYYLKTILNNSKEHAKQIQTDFEKALQQAKDNVTEKGEAIAIKSINFNYVQALSGNYESKKALVEAIQKLSEANRNAMLRADLKARNLGNAGAWGIVFMASLVFTITLFFLRFLRKNLLAPIEEINSVLQAVKSGDQFRRCTGYEAPQGIRSIFRDLNDILEQKIFNNCSYKADD